MQNSIRLGSSVLVNENYVPMHTKKSAISTVSAILWRRYIGVWHGQARKMVPTSPEGNMTFFWICQITDNNNDKVKNKMKVVPPIHVGSQIRDTACDMKFVDTCVVLESLTRKSTVQGNFKRKMPSVRGLVKLRKQHPLEILFFWILIGSPNLYIL